MAVIRALAVLLGLLLLTLVALNACTNPPPGCTGPVGMMNQGLWPPQIEARK